MPDKATEILDRIQRFLSDYASISVIIRCSCDAPLHFSGQYKSAPMTVEEACPKCGKVYRCEVREVGRAHITVGPAEASCPGRAQK